jgi:hypothetical protein
MSEFESGVVFSSSRDSLFSMMDIADFLGFGTRDGMSPEFKPTDGT